MAVRRSLVCLSSSLVSKSKLNVNVSLYFSTSVQKEQPFTVYELLVNKHQFSPQVASHVASALTLFNNPHNSDSLLSFLKENGFSITQLEIITKMRPRCLTADFEKTIKPKITLFQDMGFSPNDIAEIITKNPSILQSSIKNRIIPSLSILECMLRSSEKVAKVLKKSSWLFSVDLEECFVPNIEFFKSCGIKMEEIVKKFCLFPRLFLVKPETMKKFANKADKFGVHRSSKMFIYAVSTIGQMSNETLEFKIKDFQDLGFSKDETLRVFRSEPMLFSVTKEKIRKVKEVLLETEKYDVSCILKYPTSLMYSVETRYKPRLQVLRILEEKNLIGKWPSLATLVIIPNKKFCEKFVHPFSNELQDVKLMILSKSR